MLLRITNMRGVDLSLFDFDYDLAWFALFLDSNGRVLGRFGGRDADTPAKYQTLSGLRFGLEQALERHRAGMKKLEARKPVYAEDFPAAKMRSEKACIHCHHVHEFRRDALQKEKRWSLDNVWIYPQPENIGLTLDPDRGNHVLKVRPGSAAAQLGLKANDPLASIGNVSIASVADVQHALHIAPRTGELGITWQNGNKGTIALSDGWRKTDVSWRWSLKTLAPNPGIVGEDLDADRRKQLGLNGASLAYRHMNFLTPTARHAGLQGNDVIVGIDDQPLNMTARQFETHIRLTFRPGQEITLNVLRGMEKLKLRLRLPE